MKLLLATHNRHKVQEIREIFKPTGLELLTPADLQGLPDEIEEDADSFAGNALKKARTLSDASGLWALADDSGLQVDALNGAPGIYSARYAGPQCETAENNAKLLRELEGVKQRSARFCCAIALCAPDGRSWGVEGVCEGRIIAEQRGANGFGYDPLFVPSGYDKTFAELGSEVKNRISHRAKALKKAYEEWRELLS